MEGRCAQSRRSRREVRIDGLYDAATFDGRAGAREVLTEHRAAVPSEAKETVEMVHGAGREIVQHDEGVIARKALIQRRPHPAAGTDPIAGHDIPQHTGEAAA